MAEEEVITKALTFQNEDERLFEEFEQHSRKKKSRSPKKRKATERDRQSHAQTILIQSLDSEPVFDESTMDLS